MRDLPCNREVAFCAAVSHGVRPQTCFGAFTWEAKSAPLRLDDRRRSNRRYPVAWEIVSSRGMLIATGISLPAEIDIELSIAWPAKLDFLIRLNLHVVGRTECSLRNGTAASLSDADFKRPLT
jgi:hypothetical protein